MLKSNIGQYSLLLCYVISVVECVAAVLHTEVVILVA